MIVEKGTLGIRLLLGLACRFSQSVVTSILAIDSSLQGCNVRGL